MPKLGTSLAQKNMNRADNLYTIAFAIIVIKSVLAFSELVPYALHNFNNVVLNAAFLGIIAYKIFFFQNYSIQQVIVLLITGVACIISDFSLSRFMLIPDFLLLAATQSVDIKKNMKMIWKIEAFIISIHVLIYPILYFFFRWTINFSVRGFNNDNRIRHQFLFSHANVFSMLILWTILAYMYANFEKLDKKRIILCWIINFVFFIFTDSNSGLLILSVISIILLAREYFKNATEKLITFLSRYLFIILSVFFNFLMVIYPKTTGKSRIMWRNIDSFFTGRLKYGAYVYDKYGITLFGRFLGNNVRDYWEGYWIDGMPADCMYMFFPVWCGLFFLIAIAFIFWKYSGYATTDEKIIVISYSLYTMMETYVTYVMLCFALLLIVKYAWKDYSSKINKVLAKGKRK